MDFDDSDDKTPAHGTPQPFAKVGGGSILNRGQSLAATPKAPALAISAWDPKVMKGGKEPAKTSPPVARAISAWDVNRRPPRPDSTGKQVIAPPPIPKPDNTGKQILAPASTRAPPPSSQKVSFLPPSPARSGTTDPGGLQTRADTPHPKQRTPLPRASPPTHADAPRTGPIGAGAPPSQRVPIPPETKEKYGLSEETPPHGPISLFMSLSPIKQAAISGILTLIVLGSATGIIVNSCQREEKIEQVAPQKETKKEQNTVEPKDAKPKPTSFYIPKALSKPPQIPNRIPQRVARTSLRV